MRTRTIEEYYGEGIVARGYEAIPHLLRRHYRAAGLDEATFVFVLQLVAIDWDFGSPPRCHRDIATIMGKDISTIRRYSQRLSDLGLLHVKPCFISGQQVGNAYDLSPLWARLCDIEAHEPANA
jgi:hypothetical protein